MPVKKNAATQELTPLERDIAITKARAWNPDEKGAKVTGTLVGTRRGDGEWGPYPIAIYQDSDTGEFYAVHVFHGLAKAWYAENKPTRGSVVTHVYLGRVTRTEDELKKGKREYEDYYIVFGDGSEPIEQKDIDFSDFVE